MTVVTVVVMYIQNLQSAQYDIILTSEELTMAIFDYLTVHNITDVPYINFNTSYINFNMNPLC